MRRPIPGRVILLDIPPLTPWEADRLLCVVDTLRQLLWEAYADLVPPFGCVDSDDDVDAARGPGGADDDGN